MLPAWSLPVSLSYCVDLALIHTVLAVTVLSNDVEATTFRKLRMKCLDCRQTITFGGQGSSHNA